MFCADVKATAAEHCKVQGGSYRRGEQNCGSKHQKMTAAPKRSTDRSSCRRTAMRRPDPLTGKANVLGEATGACTLGAAGVGVQTRREGLAEITSGRTVAQQGLTATCKDLEQEGDAGGDRSAVVRRMSP